MKKIAIAMAIATLAVSSYGQGHVNLLNNASTRVSTNGAVNFVGQSLGGGSTGLTLNSTVAPSAYLYALLMQPYSGGATVSATLANVLTGGWIFTGAMGTNNLAAGGIGGGGGAIKTTSGDPVGFTNQFVIVGWSSNIGTDWATIANGLQNSDGLHISFIPDGYIGISSVGTGMGVDSALGDPAELIFGSFAGSISTGFTLFSTTPIPEPTTIAIVGFGGLSFWVIRRRNN